MMFERFSALLSLPLSLSPPPHHMFDGSDDGAGPFERVDGRLSNPPSHSIQTTRCFRLVGPHRIPIFRLQGQVGLERRGRWARQATAVPGS